MIEQTRDDELNRIETLRKEILRHDYLYHALNNPAISDIEYDLLYKELLDLEAKYPEIDNTLSPTQRVGYKTDSNERETNHYMKMYSLENVFYSAGIVKFNDRILETIGNMDLLPTYAAEPKYDGLAINLIYINGLLSSASTRGDGYTGITVTDNILNIKSIPLLLEDFPVNSLLEVRGEIYVTKANLEKLNNDPKSKKKFTNCRSAAASILLTKDQDPKLVKCLSFVAHGLGKIDNVQVLNENYGSLINYLRGLKLPTSTEFEVVVGVNGMQEYYDRMLSNRDTLPYDADGVVFKTFFRSIRNKLGYTNKHPKFAIAYKFPGEENRTKLIDINVTVGKNGNLTPVAILEPVEVKGFIITRCNLVNSNEIHIKDLRIGDTVTVRLSGDVTPVIVGSVPELREKGSEVFIMPDKCPSCSTLIISKENSNELYCPNHFKCPEQVIGSIVHFCSKKGMNIKGLGYNLVKELVKDNILTDISDIYFLTNESLMSIKRIGKLTSYSILLEVDKSKQVTLGKFIYALGINGVGEYSAFNLVKHFNYDLNAIRSSNQFEFVKVKDIGEVTAFNIQDYFSNETNKEIVDTILRRIKIIDMK